MTISSWTFADQNSSPQENKQQAKQKIAVKAMDTNRDGVISEGEFFLNNATVGLWQKLDANGDGVLDADEQSGVTLGPLIRR